MICKLCDGTHGFLDIHVKGIPEGKGAFCHFLKLCRVYLSCLLGYNAHCLPNFLDAFSEIVAVYCLHGIVQPFNFLCGCPCRACRRIQCLLVVRLKVCRIGSCCYDRCPCCRHSGFYGITYRGYPVFRFLCPVTYFLNIFTFLSGIFQGFCSIVCLFF